MFKASVFRASVPTRVVLALFASVAGLAVQACSGGGGGPVVATPAPPVATPVPAPIPAPSVNFDTAEYRRSNGAVAAQALGAYQAGATGIGVIAAVIDTGVNGASPEFAGRISPLSRDLYGTRGVIDEDGHGTAVAGTLLAARDGIGIHGVAFNATLLAFRADRPGTCEATTGCSFDSNILAIGFDAAAQARARVINMSLGGGSAPFALRAAANRAALSGAVIVLAAGNDGNPEVEGTASALFQAAPGAVIVAGALNEDRTIASFSNRAGAAAPYYLATLGSRVRSFDQTGTAFLYSGTSEAAPIISGAVALLAQAFPDLTATQIVDILLRSADDLGETGTDAIYGRGALNITRAFAPIGRLSVEKVALPLTSDPGLLASPLGDGGQTRMALSALPVRDDYGRAYAVDAGAQLRRQSPGRLANTLLNNDVNAAAGWLGTAELLLVARGIDGPAWRGDVATGVEPAQRPRGSILAVQTRVQMGKGRVAVLAYGQAAATLLVATGDAGDALTMPMSTLVADRAADGFPLAQPQSAGAFVQQIGNWRLGTAVAALVTPRFDQRGGTTANLRGTQAIVRIDRHFGAARVGVAAEWLSEDGALLGSQLPAVFGLGGATTTSLLVDAAMPFGLWSVGSTARLGRTRPDLTGGGLWSQAAPLTGTSASVWLSRVALFDAGDRVSLTIAQPLRAVGSVRLATGDELLRFGPSGREIAIEADYLWGVDGVMLRFRGFWRRHPGHIAQAAPDIGVALRAGLQF